MSETRLSTVADAPAPAGASDRPPFGAKDDIRRERKAPDRNILDRDRIVDAFKQWGIVIVFVALIVIFATLRPTTFPTLQNARYDSRSESFVYWSPQQPFPPKSRSSPGRSGIVIDSHQGRAGA